MSPAACSRPSPTSCSTGPTRRSRNCPIRRSAISRTRRSGAPSPMRARANGPEARAGFKNVDAAMARAADRTAAPGDADRAALVDRGARFRRRHAHGQRIRDHRRAARTGAVDRGADRPPERGPRPQRRCADQLSRRRRRRRDRRAAAQGRLREIVLLLRARRHAAQGRDPRARDAHHGVARRRDRGRRPQAAGASLYRGQPLSRRLPRHAHRAAGASEFRPDAQDPGRGGGDVRQPVPGRQGRRAAADRGARPVLRFPRTDADRAARRRDDPPAGRPAGLGRSARSGEPNCCSIRSIIACKARRARRSRPGWR